MYNGPFAWFFFLPAGKQKMVKRAVVIMTRAGMQTESALQVLWDADRERQHIATDYALHKTK